MLKRKTDNKIRNFCEDNDIRLDTSVAKEEHISNGNTLGTIDRLVRALRELIEKYYDITNHKYIEQRRHDYEFREKQRQYYITYYQKRKERPNYIYQNIFFNPPTKKILLLVFLLTTAHKY